MTGRESSPSKRGSVAETPDSPLEELVRIRRARFGPFVFLLLMASLMFTACWLASLTAAKLDVSYPEGSVVERAWAVSLDRPLYVDWKQWPHAFAPYGPLTYLPVGWLARLLPGEPTPWRVTVIARLQSLLSLALLGWLIYGVARRMELTRTWAWTALAICSFWGGLLEFCASYRPDAPAALAAIAAVVVMTGGPARRRRTLAVFILVSISMAFKPTALGMAPVVLLWIHRSLGWRAALAWMAGCAALGLALLLAADTRLHGMLLHNMLGANRQGFWLQGLIEFFTRPWRLEFVVMALGAVAAVRAVRADADGPARWVAFAALFNLAVSVAMLSKVGADKNYFMLPYPLLALMLTREAALIWDGRTALSATRREVLLWCVAMPLAIVPALLSLATVRDDVAFLSTALRPTPVVKSLQGTTGPILTTHPFIPMQVDAQPTLLDYFAYSALVRNGLLDPEPLRQRIDQRYFAVIVLDAGEWFKEADSSAGEPALFFEGCVPLIRRRYEFVGIAGGMVILRPKAARAVAALRAREDDPA
jgi:hypothetical protein